MQRGSYEGWGFFAFEESDSTSRSTNKEAKVVSKNDIDKAVSRDYRSVLQSS